MSIFLQVRKCSQESVALLLKSVPGDLDFHSACVPTTKFCIQELEKYKGTEYYIWSPDDFPFQHLVNILTSAMFLFRDFILLIV